MRTKDTLMAALYDHRGDIVCYDHPESYCCTCGEHEVSGYREHLADVLLQTRVIPPGETTLPERGQQP